MWSSGTLSNVFGGRFDDCPWPLARGASASKGENEPHGCSNMGRCVPFPRPVPFDVAGDHRESLIAMREAFSSSSVELSVSGPLGDFIPAVLGPLDCCESASASGDRISGSAVRYFDPGRSNSSKPTSMSVNSSSGVASPSFSSSLSSRIWAKASHTYHTQHTTTAHTTHNTQHTTHNTQHTTYNI